MTKRKTFHFQLISSLIFIFLSFGVYAHATLTELRVNYEVQPLGIDIETPRFSWQMQSDDDQRGLQQVAYQIVVQNEQNETVWDTKQVASGISLGIPYKGKALAATTRYTWTVTVWTNTDQKINSSSWFETGLMNPDPNLAAWDGANWIGENDKDMILHSHYFSVFKVQYQLQLDENSKSTKAAFLFGGNDLRLMNKDMNLNGMAVQKDESYIALELDISALQNGGNAKLNVFRVGYDANDKTDVPFKAFDIPTELINADNQYQPHKFYIDCVYGIMELFIDGKEEKNKVVKQDGGRFGSSGFNLNPFGEGNNFISFPMLADIGFSMASNQQAHFSELQVRHYRLPNNAVFSEDLSTNNYSGIFKTNNRGFKVANNAYHLNGASNGLFILADPSRNAAPMLRTTFATENKTIAKARIYATARGIYELHLNGQRVGKDYFNPGLTQYNKNHLYQTYDVTNMVKADGENALGAWLSEGWWSGAITFSGENWNYFGDRQSLLAKLVITYTDGSQTLITSNPNDWKLFTDGPVRYGSFFQGEVYDASKEAAIAGWSTADYDDSKWTSTTTVPLEGTAVVGEFRDFRGRPKYLKYDDQQLIGQIGENVSIVKTMVAQSVEEVRPGVFVYDMGQNMVGVPNISIKNGKKGNLIRMRFAEVRYPDLSEYDGNIGMIMLENIRAALTQDLYYLKGGDETIQPRFTFHGYRFIEITGIDEALPLDAVKGQVLSSIQELASSYETSNELVNRLWKNITWSLRGNFLSIPTDTPARNERMGWNGDINVFSRAATWLANANQFLKRHMLAMRDMQADDGRYSDVAPVGNGFGGTLWGSAGIIVAWETYQQYGDVSLLEEHYESMKSYVDFLASKQNEDGVLVEGPLGDWLSPENAKNDNTLLWTAYQVYNLEIMQKVATILGKTEDAAAFEQRYATRKAFFNEWYIDPATHKTVMSGVSTPSFGPPPANPPKKGDIMDTQASYAIPLAFDILKAEYKADAIEHLTNAITRKNVDDLGLERPEFSLMTGFIGTASIGEALSENGKHNIAYQLLQTETYPSWLYPVKNGATTIWERLNSYTIENGFGGNNSMNSFNHYAFGAIASWMYNYSLGIQRDPGHPGFKHFILQPTPDPTGQMTFAKGHYDAMYGTIVSEWYSEKEGTRYKIVVPPNTTAKLHLQASDLRSITDNGASLNSSAGIKQLSKEKEGRLSLELSPGTYNFFVKK